MQDLMNLLTAGENISLSAITNGDDDDPDLRDYEANLERTKLPDINAKLQNISMVSENDPDNRVTDYTGTNTKGLLTQN